MNTNPLHLRCLGLACLILLSGCGDEGGADGNGDLPGTIQIARTSYDAAEGAVVNMLVARTGGDDGVVSVDFATADGTAVAGSDYTEANGTLTWPDGIRGNLTISISIIDDDATELSESFTMTLSNVSVAALGANSSATVNIVDNDSTRLPQLEAERVFP